MKKAILIIISLLILSNVAWAQKAPDGFGDLKWGSSIEKLKEMVNIEPREIFDLPGGEKSAYFSAYDKLDMEKIGEAKVTYYSYGFSKSGKFYLARVDFPKDPNFDIFLKALTMKYGNPKSMTPLVLKINPKARIGTEYTWIIENKVEINLSFNDMEQRGVNGMLSYLYLPIWREILKEREKDAVKTKDKL